MNKTIHAYADVDSIFDSRRAIIQKHLMRDKPRPDQNASEKEHEIYRLAGDELWEKYVEKNYLNRRMDTFDYPHVELNREKFLELYNQRSIEDWGTGWFYSTNFINNFLKVIIDSEQMSEAPITINTIQLTINTFPYDFDQETCDSLAAHCKTRYAGRVDVKTVSFDSRKATTLFFKQFGYVFKYDLMLSPDYKAFFESIGSPPIPDTTFLIPDLLVQENDEFEGEIGERIFAVGLALAVVFKTVPINRAFYDYEQAV